MEKVTNTAKKPRFEWLFGGNPNAIEAQEAQGQKELQNASQLPADPNDKRIDIKEQYRHMGIKVIEQSNDDSLFFDVTLPEGWKIEPTNHSMWSDLVDNKDRKRASIFYKAAFYDRSAHINFNRRINHKVDRLSFLNNDYSQKDGEYVGYKSPFVGRVTDADGVVLFETEHVFCDVERREDRVYTEKYNEDSAKIETDLKAALTAPKRGIYSKHSRKFRRFKK